jgi:hypothetical protein
MKCKRCGEEFNMPDTNIYGNCADDLREDEKAEQAYQDREGYSIKELVQNANSRRASMTASVVR